MNGGPRCALPQPHQPIGRSSVERVGLKRRPIAPIRSWFPTKAGVVHLSRAAFDSGAGWYQLGLTSELYRLRTLARLFVFNCNAP